MEKASITINNQELCIYKDDIVASLKNMIENIDYACIITLDKGSLKVEWPDNNCFEITACEDDYQRARVKAGNEFLHKEEITATCPKCKSIINVVEIFPHTILMDCECGYMYDTITYVLRNEEQD